MSLQMYQQNILDHSKHPRNFGELPDATAKSHAANPLCGDELDFYLAFDEHQKVREVKFSGSGCTITMASASMLTEKLKGMSRDEILMLQPDDAVNMLGVDVNPARLKCATLSIEAAQQAAT